MATKRNTRVYSKKAPTQFAMTNVPLIGKYNGTVFVSYAWADQSERIVEELERTFAERGIRIVRDKKDLGYKDSIDEFEQMLGDGKCLILVISDKYLRSEHCMYELVKIDENKEFRKRIFPIVLSDANIYKAIDRLTYIQHWDEQISKLNRAMKHVSVMTNLTGIAADLDKYACIRANFDHLTDLLSDMNTLTPELHAANGFSTLIGAVESALAEGFSKQSDTSPSTPRISGTRFKLLPKKSRKSVSPLEFRAIAFLTTLILAGIAIVIGEKEPMVWGFLGTAIAISIGNPVK